MRSMTRPLYCRMACLPLVAAGWPCAPLELQTRARFIGTTGTSMGYRSEDRNLFLISPVRAPQHAQHAYTVLYSSLLSRSPERTCLKASLHPFSRAQAAPSAVCGGPLTIPSMPHSTHSPYCRVQSHSGSGGAWISGSIYRPSMSAARMLTPAGALSSTCRPRRSRSSIRVLRVAEHQSILSRKIPVKVIVPYINATALLGSSCL